MPESFSSEESVLERIGNIAIVEKFKILKHSLRQNNNLIYPVRGCSKDAVNITDVNPTIDQKLSSDYVRDPLKYDDKENAQSSSLGSKSSSLQTLLQDDSGNSEDLTSNDPNLYQNLNKMEPYNYPQLQPNTLNENRLFTNSFFAEEQQIVSAWQNDKKIDNKSIVVRPVMTVSNYVPSNFDELYGQATNRSARVFSRQNIDRIVYSTDGVNNYYCEAVTSFHQQPATEDNALSNLSSTDIDTGISSWLPRLKPNSTKYPADGK